MPDPEDTETQRAAVTCLNPTTTVPELPIRTVVSVASLKGLGVDSYTNIGPLQIEDNDISLIRCFVERRSTPSVLERRQLFAFGQGLQRHFPRFQVKDSCVELSIVPRERSTRSYQAMELSHEARGHKGPERT
ncbi:hypothetical protein RRG08_055899 [Elysia crispata]|uniref:Uncharacterized protein n=1 Tax=Elysia crispata TaxID=231223 RepID=A0AAE0Y405_9GAST|nr:hypothetical protein RRG08_055899 [Elysia crispata]